MLYDSLGISNIWKIKYTKRKSFAKDAQQQTLNIGYVTQQYRG